MQITSAGIAEDRGGVKGDDVDTAHLLGQHDGEGGACRPAHTGNGEKLDEAGDVVGAADDVGFFLDLGVDVVQIARGLEGRVAQAAEGAESIGVAALFDVPSGRFGAEVDTDQEWDGGNHGRTELETPSDRDNVVDSQIGAETEEDTECCPHLP